MLSGFTVTTWNLLHAMAIPPNTGATLYGAMKALADEVNSDVIAIQEVDLHQSRSGNGNQVREIAEIIGAKYWAFAPSIFGTPGEKWEGITEDLVFDNSNLLENLPLVCLCYWRVRNVLASCMSQMNRAQL
ncbi:MAG: hypothetical protein EBZ99_05595 [Actinobacteria bacterium]|nr:hypothetical protein [Actinomycetota bacterium]